MKTIDCVKNAYFANKRYYRSNNICIVIFDGTANNTYTSSITFKITKKYKNEKNK